MGLGSFAGRVVATNVVATDGTGDYTDIQTAIDALPAGGGVVYIKEGTYNITASIDIDKDNVSIIGAGRATTIFLAAGSNASPITILSHDGIIISEIQIDGNEANNTGGTAYGIFISNSSDITVKDCIIHECHDSGILVLGTSNKATIRGNTIYANLANGIQSAAGTNASVIGNRCRDHTDAAASSGIDIPDGSEGVYTGNICLDNKYGIRERSTSDSNVITSNVCLGNATAQVATVGANSQVANNVIA